MNASLLDRLVDSVDLEANLLPFLRYSGWQPAEPGNPHWIVLLGELDASDRPLELVFPREGTSGDKRAYVHKAAELLAVLNEKPLQVILQSIINYDRDMVYVRNLETEDEHAIALDLAVDQVNGLKHTIQFSACSESQAKPYFVGPTPASRKSAAQFLFGHTFAGSFGFTVEAPRLPALSNFVQRALPPLEADLPPLPVNTPFARRVVERIVRGLRLAESAEKEGDVSTLVEGYESGFNSNMCTAIVEISKRHRASVEFRIEWSPKVPPSDDIRGVHPVRLRSNGYALLDEAAAALRKREPEYVTIVGHVRALTASDNPASLGTRRAIVVRSALPGSRRQSDVIVDLAREDYAAAMGAHLGWRNVQVGGVLSRSGTGWRLLNQRDFKALG